jgi:hypothetical protein
MSKQTFDIVICFVVECKIERNIGGEGSFRDGVMVLHTVDAILLWAPSERVLMQEVGGAMSEQGLVDLELLRGGRADAIRSIVRCEWEQ